MTITYGEVGVSYAAVTFSYDGTELNIDPYDVLIYYHAEGRLSSYATTGSLTALRATGPRAAFTSVGPYAPTMTAAGSLVSYAVTGPLSRYNATGVDVGLPPSGWDSGFDGGFG